MAVSGLTWNQLAAASYYADEGRLSAIQMKGEEEKRKNRRKLKRKKSEYLYKILRGNLIPKCE